jgi:hypothetical protein
MESKPSYPTLEDSQKAIIFLSPNKTPTNLTIATNKEDLASEEKRPFVSRIPRITPKSKQAVTPKTKQSIKIPKLALSKINSGEHS